MIVLNHFGNMDLENKNEELDCIQFQQFMKSLKDDVYEELLLESTYLAYSLLYPLSTANLSFLRKQQYMRRWNRCNTKSMKERTL